MLRSEQRERLEAWTGLILRDGTSCLLRMRGKENLMLRSEHRERLEAWTGGTLSMVPVSILRDGLRPPQDEEKMKISE
jgi:hypothetical protein